MKLKYLVILFITFCSCKARLSKNQFDICAIKDFSQKIETVALSDTSAIIKLHNKFIRVDGYLRFEPENVAIYEFKDSESKTALWLNFSDNIVSQIEKLDGMYDNKIAVIGRVNSKNKGHFSEYIAELDSVFCLKLIK